MALAVLLVGSGYLRFAHLGYSDLQDDEKKTQVRVYDYETPVDFFLRQRKGPMQFVVAYLPFALFNPKREVNELAVRVPFALANLLSVCVVYGLVYKLTSNRTVALATAWLYSVNGFVVGFARIAQYQSLNLLFSLLSLYFLADLPSKGQGYRRAVFLASLFGSLSLLAHWDAIFYLVPTAYFLLKFLRAKTIPGKEKAVCLGIAAVTCALLVVPFSVVYVYSLLGSQPENVDYFFSRVGMAGSSLARHKYIFELYTPELALGLYIGGLISALAAIRKTGMVVGWFAVNFVVLKLCVITPKTHIYNYVLPAILGAALGYYYLYTWLTARVPRARYGLVTAGVGILVLLTCQSYLIFVDHSYEYPFDPKQVLWHTNTALYDKEIITFGFPHARKWKEVNQHIDPECEYITNESKGISQIYVKANYGSSRKCYYLVVIKRPFYTKTQGAVYAGATSTKLVYSYVKNGEMLTKVYKMK